MSRCAQRGALSLSLVADEGGEIVGQIAFSSVTVDGRACGWMSLGPVAVRGDRQGQGIGGLLIETGLGQLRAAQIAGCVLLGDPRFYKRFGFVADRALRYPGAPPAYFQRVALSGPLRAGEVAFHPAFGGGP